MTWPKNQRPWVVAANVVPTLHPHQTLSTCWCDTASVIVTHAEVRAGVTKECGRKRCRPSRAVGSRP